MAAKIKLWDYHGGEPFMENPHLAIFNSPRKRKGKKKMAKRSSAKARMAYVRSFRKNSSRRKTRRSRPRRNFPLSAMVANPRRRRRHHVRRSRSYRPRRNPAFLGLTLPPVQSVLFAAAGFAGTPMVEGFLNQFIPVSITGNTIGKYAVKLGSAMLLAFGIRKAVGVQEGNLVAIGGGAYVLTSAVAEFLPSLGLGAYVDAGMGAYVDAGMGAPSNMMLPSAGGNGFGVDNPAAIGGTAIRFRRF